LSFFVLGFDVLLRGAEHLVLLGGGGTLLGLLWEKHGVDVGENTAGSDGHASEELVELLIVADGELDVTWGDALLVDLRRSGSRAQTFPGRYGNDDEGVVRRRRVVVVQKPARVQPAAARCPRNRKYRRLSKRRKPGTDAVI
jgi:hypothetical protein